jgi:putative transcriptional regulator
MTTKVTRKNVDMRVADQIIGGLKEALAFERGERQNVRVDRVPITARHAKVNPPPAFKRERIVDLRKKKLGVSQAVFASVLNVSPETVRAWEQGKHMPGGPALRLLEIVDKQPEFVRVVQVVSMNYDASRAPSAVKAIAAKRNPLVARYAGVARKK